MIEKKDSSNKPRIIWDKCSDVISSLVNFIHEFIFSSISNIFPLFSLGNVYAHSLKYKRKGGLALPKW